MKQKEISVTTVRDAGMYLWNSLWFLYLAFFSSWSSFIRLMERAFPLVFFFGTEDMVCEPRDVLQRENNSERTGIL